MFEHIGERFLDDAQQLDGHMRREFDEAILAVAFPGGIQAGRFQQLLPAEPEIAPRLKKVVAVGAHRLQRESQVGDALVQRLHHPVLIDAPDLRLGQREEQLRTEAIMQVANDLLPLVGGGVLPFQQPQPLVVGQQFRLARRHPEFERSSESFLGLQGAHQPRAEDGAHHHQQKVGGVVQQEDAVSCKLRSQRMDDR